MGVNLEVFHGIWSSRLYKCRPAGEPGSLGLMPATQMPPRWG